MGSGVVILLASIIILCGVVALFFVAIPGMSPDPVFTQIARIAVGVAAFVVFLFAVAGALGFGGGGLPRVDPGGILLFAGGLILVLVVIKVVKMAAAAFLPAPIADITIYVVGALALAALLFMAYSVLFGGGLRAARISETQPPFHAARIAGFAAASLSARAGADHAVR